MKKRVCDYTEHTNVSPLEAELDYTAAHMKRPIGLVLTSVVQLLFGALFFLCSAVTLATVTVLKTPNAEVSRGTFVGMALMYAAMGGGAVITAIGLLKLKTWARYLTIVAAGFLAFTCTFTAAVFGFVPLPSDIGSREVVWVRTILVSLFAAMDALAIWWLWYFNRAKAREVFAAAAIERGEVASESGRPLAITIIGWLFILSGVASIFVMLAGQQKVAFVGVLISGVAAKITQVLWNTVYIGAGFGLLRLRREAYYATVALSIMAIVNMLLMYRPAGRQERMEALLQGAQTQAANPEMLAFLSSPVYGVFIVVILLVPLYFVISRRKAFGIGAS